MGKYINLETHVRPNDSMSIMTIEEMLKRYTDGYSKEAQVELVRCKDCKYWNSGNVLMGCYWDIDGGQPEEIDFCSYGKRKE